MLGNSNKEDAGVLQHSFGFGGFQMNHHNDSVTILASIPYLPAGQPWGTQGPDEELARDVLTPDPPKPPADCITLIFSCSTDTSLGSHASDAATNVATEYSS